MILTQKQVQHIQIYFSELESGGQWYNSFKALVYLKASTMQDNITAEFNFIYFNETASVDPEVRVRFPALSDFLRSSGSGTGSTQPREHNWRAIWK
jgi:hypothetical protein